MGLSAKPIEGLRLSYDIANSTDVKAYKKLKLLIPFASCVPLPLEN